MRKGEPTGLEAPVERTADQRVDPRRQPGETGRLLGALRGEWRDRAKASLSAGARGRFGWHGGGEAPMPAGKGGAAR